VVAWVAEINQFNNYFLEFKFIKEKCLFQQALFISFSLSLNLNNILLCHCEGAVLHPPVVLPEGDEAIPN
jgi:hypothetical protein